MQVILAHATHLYIDHPYEPDPEEIGLFWATRSISTRTVFDYVVPVDNRKVNVSSFVQNELCKLYAMSKCFPLTAPDNIIGKSFLSLTLWECRTVEYTLNYRATVLECRE